MRRAPSFAALLAVAAGFAACATETVPDPLAQGDIDFDPERPGLAEVGDVAPYAGDDPIVTEAQTEFRTGFDLHTKVIRRTCGPTGGVCHNSKEFPDLHTPANLLSAVGAPCNVQSGSYEAVFDRCERPGDRVRLGEGPEREVGWLEYVPGGESEMGERGEDFVPDAMTPGLHVYVDASLRDAGFGERNDTYAAARFTRKFVTDAQRVEPLSYFAFETRWWLADEGKHLFGEVQEYQADRVTELLAVGVVEGDANRNDIFGARGDEPVRLIDPGNPEESYLIARLRGEMLGEKIPGSRMPLANQPLSVAEMLALMCFIEGLPAGSVGGDEVTLASAIDYVGCSYSADPESLNLLGSGVTWEQRVKQILEFNCGGCHSDPAPQAGLSLKDGDVYARLLQPSTQLPDLNLIEPGDPDASYLWLKVTADERIMGSPMPLDPLNGTRRLTEAELADIKAWIEAGAVENQ
jgi:hypothetical protein